MTVKPVRLQLSRKRGFNLQELSRATNGLEAVNVARPGRRGNHHRIGFCFMCAIMHTREQAVRKFSQDAQQEPMRSAIVNEARGKNVACWCGPDEACHGDPILTIANSQGG